MVEHFGWLLASVTLAVAVLAKAPTLYAQDDYLLRYVPGSPAARAVDSLTATLDKTPARGKGARLLGRPVIGASDDPTRLAAFAKTLPVGFWEGVAGVVRVAEARPLQQRSGLPDDPGFPEQWHLHRIDAVGAWDYTTGGRTVTGERVVIGVIELDGYDVGHPDLRGNFYVNPGERPGNGLDDDGNGYIDDVSGVNFDGGELGRAGHGTHVAGILGARGNDGSQAAGLNWDARLLPLQISNSVQWVLALDYLTDLRARFNASGGRDGAYVVVTNCSFGADAVDCGDPDFAEVDAAIERAGRVGILTVGSTTNDLGDVDRRASTPSSCASDFLVVATASDRDDGLVPSAGFSATRVDLAAPGATLRSLDYLPLRGGPQSSFTGTSAATPQVAGTIALMYAAGCESTVARSLTAPAAVALEMRAYLLEAVDAVSQLRVRVASGGRLNARRAVEAVVTSAPCESVGLIAQVDPGAVPPAEISAADASLSLDRAISARWGLHRYRVDAGSREAALRGLRVAGGVRRASHDVALRRSATSIVPGGGSELPGVGDAEVIGQILDEEVSPRAALFDFAFGTRSGAVIASRHGSNASLGAHGAALAAVVSAITEEPVDSLALYGGYRLSDYLEAAARASARAGDDAGAGEHRGAWVFASATWVPERLVSADVEGIIRLALDSLAAANVIAVLPEDGSANASAERSGAALRPRASEAIDRALAPEGPFGLASPASCTIAGPVATVGGLAGAAALLSTVTCPGGGAQDARAVGAALARAGGPGGELDVVGAARVLLAECTSGSDAGTLLAYPNPVVRGAPLKILHRGGSATEYEIVDAAGRTLRRVLAPGGETGARILRLPTADLPAGVLWLRGSSDARGTPLLLVD